MCTRSMAPISGPPSAAACPAKLMPPSRTTAAPSITLSQPRSALSGASRCTRRASLCAIQWLTARANEASAPSSATRMLMANGVQPNGAAKSSGKLLPWPRWPPEATIGRAARVRYTARPSRAIAAATLIGPHGAATSRVPEAASAGRAEKSQKITIPASDSAAASASHRAATTSSPEESEVDELVTFGGGAVPVGSMPKAKIPLPTCPSTAEVTWYETV